MSIRTVRQISPLIDRFTDLPLQLDELSSSSLLTLPGLGDGAIAVYNPGISDGNVLESQLVDGDGTVTGVHVQTSYNNLDGNRGMFAGDGERYVTIPTSIGLDNTTFTVLIDCILPTYSADTVLFRAYIDGSNYFQILHDGANQIIFRQRRAGAFVTLTLAGVSENERIVIQGTATSSLLSCFIFQSASTVTNSAAVLGGLTSPYVEIGLVANGDGSFAVLSGTFIGLVALYNEAKTEAFGQSIYDSLHGRTLGAEEITNGGFDTDTDWTKGTGWTISSGVASCSGVSSTTLSQASVFVIGLAYEITFTVSNYSAGLARFIAGSSVVGISRNANGTYVETVISDGSTLFIQSNGGTFVGDIDNVVVKQVTNTGQLASTILPTLSPTGVSTGTADSTSETALTDIGVSDFIANVRVPSPSSEVDLILRKTPNSEFYHILKWTSGDALEIHESTFSDVGLDFDGVDDYVDVGSPAALDNLPTSGFSVGGWINARSDGEGNQARIFHKQDTNAGWFLHASGESGGKIKLGLWVDFNGTSAWWQTTATEIDINTWTHIVVTYDGSSVANDPIVYIDNVTITISETVTPVGTIDDDSGENLFIGNNKFDSRTWDGILDDLFIVNRILTLGEVTEAYGAGTPIDILDTTFASDVVAFYPMETSDNTPDVYPLILDRTDPTFGIDLVTNGDFANWTADDPDGWITTEVGDATSNITENPAGECQIVSDGTHAQIRQIILTVGKMYIATMDINAITGNILWGTTAAAFEVLLTTGTKTFYFIADSTDFRVRNNGSVNATIDNVVVVEASANHGIMINMTASDLVTTTLKGSIASVADALMKIAFIGEQLTIYKNGSVAFSYSGLSEVSGNYGTHYQLQLNGDTVTDFEMLDTYGEAPADILEFAQFLDADALYRLGVLTEALGYDTQDMTSNEMRVLNNTFNFLESDSAMVIPYNARLNSDTFLRAFLPNAYSSGGINSGRFYQQTATDAFNILTGKAQVQTNYTTANLVAKTSTSLTFGESVLLTATINESNNRGLIFANTNEETLGTDTLGTGGRIVAADDFYIGNRSALDIGFYGTMSSFAFFHQLATESLMRWMQVYFRLRDYYSASVAITNADARFIATPDGDFWDTVTNASMNASGNSAGTVLSEYGSYGTIGYFDISSVLPATLTSISGVFNVGLDLVDGVNSLIYIQSGTDELHLYTTAINLILSYYDGTFHTAQYTLSGMSLSDGDNCEIAFSVSSTGLELWVNGIQVATDPMAFIPFTSYTAKTVIGAIDLTGFVSYDKSIHQASLKFNSTLSAIDIMRHRNLISANGAEWYKYLNDTYTMTKLNNSSGDNLLESGGSADTLSGATADGGFAPSGEVYIDFTSASHLNIGLTELSVNNKRYSIWVQPSATAVSTTEAYVFRLRIDNDNYFFLRFSTVAAQLHMQYRANAINHHMAYDTASAGDNLFIEIDIPASGKTAELFVNGVSVDAVALTEEMVGTTLVSVNTLVGGRDTSNNDPLLSLATNLQISEIPTDGLSDYDNAVGISL